MSRKIKLWGRVTSSNVKKVLWVAYDLELAIERVDAGGKFGVVDTPAYRALNPNGRVPTIEDGDFVLWESNAIMRYLCDQYGGAALYPADPRRRADIDRWLDWSLSVLVAPDTRVFLATIRVPEEKHDRAQIAKLTEAAGAAYGILEQHLAGRKYAAGDHFSLADIALSIYVDRWLRNPYLSVKQDYPNCAAWLAGVRAEQEGFRTFVEIPLE
jgi:glutathione S-transferase